MRLFALTVAVALLASTVLADDERPLVEPETEVSFPARLTPPGAAEGAAPQHLLGVGVREKWVFDVYAIGLYVDPPAVHRRVGAALEAAAAPGARETAAEVADRRLGELNHAAVPRTLQLVMVRDVDAEDMREAFEDVLQPRIKARARGERRTAALAALKAFRAVFSRPATEGQVLRFAWHPAAGTERPARLVVSVDGSVRHTSQDPDLAWALFDVYVGNDPISDSARASSVKRLPDLAERGRPAPAAAPDEASRGGR